MLRHPWAYHFDGPDQPQKNAHGWRSMPTDEYLAFQRIRETRCAVTPVLFVAAAIICCGCSTHADRLRDSRQLFFRGDLAAASQTLDKADSFWHRDKDCLKLDQAMIALVDGRPKDAESRLREVRDQFDYLGKSSLSENALSMLTDDKQRAYPGEDYEQVLIRVFLALSNLMGDGQDAVAYSLQIEEKQSAIIAAGLPGTQENPKLAYKQLAIAPYLHGVLREANHADYDDAAKSFAKVVSWEPRFGGGHQDLERAQRGAHSQPGHGVVYIFALVGRGPYKEEAVETPTSDALLIADRILSALGKYQLPPTIAPIKVPRVVIPHNEVDGVMVRVDQQPVGGTQTISHIGEMAVLQHQAILPHLVARAVVRRVTKKAVAYGAQDGLNIDNQWATLGILAAGVVWEFAESADTRCWGLLPNQIQVQRIELPAGDHQIGLGPTQRGLPLGPAETCQVSVVDGRNTYVLACFPDRRLTGKIQVSDPHR
jgi:hypothetical protein